IADSPKHGAHFGLRGHRNQVGAFVSFASSELSDSKIQNFYLAVACDEKILRLEVTMDNALFMRRYQAVGDLASIICTSPHGKWATDEFLPERFSLQHLGNDVGRSVV